MVDSLIGIGVFVVGALAATSPLFAVRWWRARRENGVLWLQLKRSESENRTLREALQRHAERNPTSALRVVR